MKASESKTVSQSQHQDQQAETAFFQMKEDSTALPEAQPFFQAGNANAFGQSMFSEGSPFFTPGGIQTKLKIGHPNDKYEVEADSMADSVVERLSNQDTSSPGENSQAAESQNASPGVPSSSLAQASPLDNEGLQKKDGEEEVQMMDLDLQRKPIFESAADPTDENVQTKPLSGQITPFIQRAEDEELQAKLVQRKGEDTPTPSDGFESRLQQSKGGGQSLPDDTRSEMEGQFGADFSGVRVHTGSEATGMSNEIGAQAFTHGNDIYFNEGKYDTGSNSGKHLLAHELTHTIQQGAVVRSKPISKTNTGPVVQRFLGIGDLLNSIARHIPGYTLITVILGKNPLTGDAVPRTPENFLGGFLGLIPGGTLLADKLRETGALAEAGNWLAAEVAKLNFTWGYIKGLISKAWDEVSIWKGISGNIAVVKRIFGEPWRRLKTFAGNILGKIQEFIFRGALKLVGAPVETIMNIINKGKAVLMKIITDPIGFFKNLAGAVGKGIQQFVKNIKKHLIGGLVTWLTGAMADIPIQLPSKWDLKGIIFLVLQILGLTYQRIRKHIVKVVGEKPVALAEKGLDILKRIVTEGPIALWEMIKEKAAEIKQSVMEGIRNWVITKLVKSAIVQVLSMLNPAGALVQAAMKIYQFVMFLYENISRIMDFVKSIFNSIGEIAMGALGKAANFIENAMAKAIPIILNFLARLINLSGVGKAVKKIIEKIRKPIDKVIGKIVKFISKKIRKLFGKGKDAKKDDSKQKYTKKDKDAGLAAFEKEEKPFVKDNTIGQDDAKKVAKNVKKKHPVFKSISVVDGKDSWDYKYVFRAKKDTKSKKAIENKIGLPKGVGPGRYILEIPTQKVYRLASVNKDIDTVVLIDQTGKPKRPSIKAFVDDFGKKYKITNISKDVPKMPIATLRFGRDKKYNASEFKRQLKGQEAGLNAMTIFQWEMNKEIYADSSLKSLVKKEDSKARSEFNTQEKQRLINLEMGRIFDDFNPKFLQQNLSKGMSKKDAEKDAFERAYVLAEKEATKKIQSTTGKGKTAATHDADKTGGGNILGLTRLGHSGVNSSIGAQWKNANPILISAVKVFKNSDSYSTALPENQKKVRLNVRLKMFTK